MYAFQREIKMLPCRQLMTTGDIRQDHKCIDPSFFRSVQKCGVIVPVLVRRCNPLFFEVIDGARRLTACRLCGQKEIPAIIFDCDREEADVLTFLCNQYFLKPHYLEVASFARTHLSDFSRCAAGYGISASDIDNMERLSAFSETQRLALEKNQISRKEAEQLAAVSDECFRFVVQRLETEDRVDRLIDLYAESQKKQKKTTLTEIISMIHRYMARISVLTGKNGYFLSTREEKSEDEYRLVLQIKKK